VAQLYPQAPSTHFSRLLRHAWATVGLFFSPVTTRGFTVLYNFKLNWEFVLGLLLSMNPKAGL